MKRRAFAALAAAAMFAPRSAWAQSPKQPLIGVLFISNPEPFRTYFLDRMRELGHVEGKSIRLEYRNAEGDSARLSQFAAELVRIKVDVIVAVQTPAVHAAKKATGAIPIAFTAGDPVGTGLVQSLARPGGNATGMSSTTAELGGKLLEVARELLPSLQRMAVLANRHDPFTKPFLKQIEEAGLTAGIAISQVSVAGSAEFEAAFAAFVKLKADAVIVQPSLPRKPALELATKHRLPSISPSAPFVTDGGLLAYSAKFAETYGKVAEYVDKILKGAKPADLPIQQATLFELAVNRKTARALGISIPQSILARADRVID